MPFEADGRWFSNRGQVPTDNADNNVIEALATDGGEDCLVRRAAFRGDKFVATFKFEWNADVSHRLPGPLALARRLLGDRDRCPSDGKSRLYKRQNV